MHNISSLPCTDVAAPRGGQVLGVQSTVVRQVSSSMTRGVGRKPGLALRNGVPSCLELMSVLNGTCDTPRHSQSIVACSAASMQHPEASENAV